MGKVNQCQTGSCEVFDKSDKSYEQYINHCIYLFLYATYRQLSLNTMLFNLANFCRNFKGIQSWPFVFNNIVIYVFLIFSTIFAYFNKYQTIF